MSHPEKVSRRQFIRRAAQSTTVLASPLAPVLALAQQTGPLLEVTDWSKAEGAGWTFSDSRNGQNSGKASASGANLNVLVNQANKASWAEVGHVQPLSVPERFALSVRARFLHLGQDDDSSGAKSHLQFLLGVQSPHGELGFNIGFTADRYKLDDKVKIYRTKSEWHDWRFEIDTRRKTVAMFRDGEYVCLHQGGMKQPPGVRLITYGAADVPTELEVGPLQITPLPADDRPLAPRPMQTETTYAPGEWPMWRRDVCNSGASPLVGHIKKPRIAWKHPVGGVAVQPILLDVNGDGVKEVVFSQGGNLSAYRLDGTLLWKYRVERAVVFGAYDLDGDGEQEVIIAAGQVQVLRGKDGKLLYACDQFPTSGVGGIRVAKLDPDKKGLQAVVWSPLHEIGYTLSFAEGAAKAKVEYTYNWKMTGFTPPVALVDMDKDGLLEIVAATYDHIFVFDGRTGSVKMSVEWNSGRNYGLVVVKDIDGDGYPDVVMLADVLREHVGAIKNEAGKSLKLLWNTFYEQNYPEDHKELRVVTESVDDFDGDGRFEIAYSLFDDTADSTWHTLIVDALTGEIKHKIAGRYLTGAGALFPGQPPVLLLSTPSGRSRLNTNRVAVWTGKGGAWNEQATLPVGTPLSPHTLFEFAPNVWGQVSGIGNGLPTTVIHEHSVTLVRGKAGAERVVQIVQGDASGKLTTVWQDVLPRELPSGSVARVEPMLPGKGKGARQILFSGADGILHIVGEKGVSLSRIDTQAGFVTVPVVAKLQPGAAPSILYLNAEGKICCVRAPRTGGPPRPLWSRPSIDMPAMPAVSHLRLLGCPCVPMIADLEGKGTREVIAAQYPDKLVSLDADGKVQRTWKFPALPVFWTHGNFDGDSSRDIFVTYQTGQWLDVMSVALAGKDGKTLWQSHCGNGPAAVYDLDGDGRDDVTLRDLYEHRTLSGVSGRDLYPTTSWAGYHTPTVAALDGPAKPPGLVWVGGSYSLVVENLGGEKRWWKPFQAQGLEAVADVDGDGKLEIGGATAGQLYNWPDFYAVDGPNKEFLCMDALTSHVKWSYPIAASTSSVIAADVDGDGRPEFLFGTGDGRLIALRGETAASQRVLWEITFPAAMGTPIVCDADGDGQMEILVGCADGNLYCVK